MKIILGLGNPGADYVGTRHNAGVDFVDKLVSSQFIVHSSYGWRKHYDALVYKTSDLVLVKTKDVFMNESGRLITSPPAPLLISGEGSNLYVAHDDLDLKLGEYKIQFGKGPKDHNGVESVENALKTKDFWRIRIGIDNRVQGRSDDRASRAKSKVQGEEYVLQKFTPEEREILDGVLEKIVSEITHP